MAKQRMSIEWVKRVNALKRQGFDVHVTTDADGVMIHMAHGYLLCTFLSPFSNKREDQYGKDLAGRARFPLEVLKSVRACVGADFPIICRLSGDEYVEGGLEKALNEDPRPGARRKLDGRGEAYLIALTCSDAPDEHEHWALRLLADELVELGIVESISHETVRQYLKKTS